MQSGHENASLAKFKAEVERLLTIKQVLEQYPVSKSAWYSGVRAGRYPAPVKLGLRRVAWRQSSIDELIASLQQGGAQ